MYLASELISSGGAPMRRISGIVVATLLLCASSGCGTLLNVEGRDALIVDSRPLDEMRKHERPPYPFGGVANDMAWLNGAEEPIGVIGCVVDLPLSITGDIITLPWTAYQSLIVRRQSALP
jgi:uncharacterized protein YceK